MNPHTRDTDILRVYSLYSRPLTDREVAKELGYNERNAVSPRITENIKGKKGKRIFTPTLKKVGTRQCDKTHATCRLVTLINRPRTTKPMFENLS